MDTVAISSENALPIELTIPSEIAALIHSDIYYLILWNERNGNAETLRFYKDLLTKLERTFSKEILGV